MIININLKWNFTAAPLIKPCPFPNAFNHLASCSDICSITFLTQDWSLGFTNLRTKNYYIELMLFHLIFQVFVKLKLLQFQIFFLQLIIFLLLKAMVTQIFLHLLMEQNMSLLYYSAKCWDPSHLHTGSIIK